MNHAFDIEHARLYGLPEAVMITNFQFWIAKNKANKENLHEGRTWTYNSIAAFAELFPYLSEGQIRRTLDSLVAQKVLITGNYNEKAVDRTKWYAFIDECIFLPEQLHLPKTTNATGKSSKSLTKTDINADVNADKSPAPAGAVPKDGAAAPSIFVPIESLRKLGVDERVANDWLKLRKEKKQPLTETALDGVVKQAEVAGLSVADAVRTSCENGWAGFKASWVAPAAGKAGQLGGMGKQSVYEQGQANGREAAKMLFGDGHARK